MPLQNLLHCLDAHRDKLEHMLSNYDKSKHMH